VPLAHLLLEFHGLLLIDDFGGPFDEGDDIAHAEDALGHPFGVEQVEVLGFFAGAHELDGFADDGTEGEGGAASGITIEFGEDGAGDAEGLVEVGGDVDGFLAGGGVEDEEDLAGLGEVTEPDEFLDEGFVDLETAGGIEDDGVAGGGTGFGKGFAADLQDIGLAGTQENGDAEFVAEDLELVHGGGTIDIGGDEEDVAALAGEESGEFGGGGGLAGAMKTAHEDAGGAAGEGEGGVVGAQQRDDLIMDDLDHLLAWADGLEHLFADGLGTDGLDEVACDLEIDVGFEEGEADVAEGVADIGL